MLFNLFGRKEEGTGTPVFTDRAYVSTTAKMKACADLARKDSNHLFICWFAETAAAYKEYFKEQGLDENQVLETRQLHTAKLQHKIPVFTEHYPLHEKEINLVKNWDNKNILVFSALDEPLFKHFGSEKLIPLMKMLGMKEDEPIEHQMVSKSIIKGQEKITQQVAMEQSASSQEEWMQKNIK